jgi:hypothetical protein
MKTFEEYWAEHASYANGVEAAAKAAFEAGAAAKRDHIIEVIDSVAKSNPELSDTPFGAHDSIADCIKYWID